MFGRVRAPSSSPDELERHTAKLLKHDSLSIYESTLLKLRIGCQHANDTPPEEMQTENDGKDMEADSNPIFTCPRAIVSPQGSMTVDDGAGSCADNLSRSSSGRAMSIHHLFSRYKGSKATSLIHDQMMTTENNRSPSIPPNSGNNSCLSNMDQHLDTDRISSIIVGSV
ncbi:uncharacterized protein LOC116188030 [Punica granatum]|uniref:Uncharacterized protein LOC116188030 n=1 Tax=Punica granatum TaxID=22663 RepID=A0A6P8BRN5_PUNGR|nr:uncharacterized protein LOC116188030 [Punica granatum]